MRAIEINFDGIVGPTHNYAGLSLGNVASAANLGAAASPRSAALQGLAKMRRLVRLGLAQGVLPPHARPDPAILASLGFRGPPEAEIAAIARSEPGLAAALVSASPMWTANAATVSPSADAADGRTHLSVANLAAMPHRAFEPAETLSWLRRAFAAADRFCVHPPLPAGVHLGDEGAANHMRVAPEHGAPGVEIFVHGGVETGPFPARQRRHASMAIARRHGLDPARTVFLEQSARAIQAGAFHNDVVAVANERTLFVHAAAFERQEEALARVRAAAPFVNVIEVAEEAVSLPDAIGSYLFNAQLLTLPDGSSLLVAPAECRENAATAREIDRILGAGAGIDRVEFFDLKESMRNGGGPACLRLRVVATADEHAAIDPRFLVDEAKLDRLEAVIAARWPAQITPGDFADPELWRDAAAARTALLETLGLSSAA